MIRYVALIFLLSLLAVSISQNDSCTSSKCNGEAEKARRDCNVCHWRTKNVTLIVRNVFREPFFEEVVNVTCTRYKTLFYIMQQAAMLNSVFKFQATYSPKYGFFVDSINNTAGTWKVDKSYWEILNSSLLQTDLGVSSYKPSNDEVITFNLTSGGHCR